ncbi:uncharacterized protein M421DRAFT_46877, partial [Didymella exigua CBS 183.55]
AALLEAPWEARTPSNHKSSSPASIIKAINQLKKGAEVIILSAELMRDQITSLERANKAASARK